MKTARILAGFSGIAFIFYGFLCFYSPSMASDFHRFGLDNLRVLTGILEILGGSGLLIGLRWEPARWISAAALALLMLFAFAIRLKMHDGVALSLPSFSFMLLNLYILIRAPKSSPFAALNRTRR